MAPVISWSRPYFRASSVPKDQPSSQGAGSLLFFAYCIAAARSWRSAVPPSKVPSLVPVGELVPRVLKRRIARFASSGSLFAALRRMCDSMKPPAVGSGCRVMIVAFGGVFAGSASSPCRRSPSLVCSVRDCLRERSTVLLVIWCFVSVLFSGWFMQSRLSP